MPDGVKVRGGRLKHVMKEALTGVLPADILDRKKRGFGTPMGAWLKGELAPLLRHAAVAGVGGSARPVPAMRPSASSSPRTRRTASTAPTGCWRC